MNAAEWIDLIYRIGAFVVGGIISAATFSWFILHNFFVKKTDHNTTILEIKSNVKTITDTLVSAQKNIDEIKVFEKNLQSLGQDFAIFKTQYQGDNELRKEQDKNRDKMLGDILHKVNNAASFNFTKVIEMVVEEKLKK